MQKNSTVYVDLSFRNSREQRCLGQIYMDTEEHAEEWMEHGDHHMHTAIAVRHMHDDHYDHKITYTAVSSVSTH